MKNLVLIGFMGSGKTTAGIRLSYLCRLPFLDLDREIERQQGKSISEIFAQDGEACFRQLETDFLKTLPLEKQGFILSAGGGTPLREENRPLLKAAGTVIYLKTSAQSVWERLKGDTTRPLLAGEDPRGRIEELLAKRCGVYEALADLTVETDGRSGEEIAAEIYKRAGMA